MGVERNINWGDAAPLPTDLNWFNNDASAMAYLEPFCSAGDPIPPVGLRGGDLFRMLGGRSWCRDTRPGQVGARFVVDLGAVHVDGQQHWFLAHCVIRRSWLCGRVIFVGNAAFIGSWNAAPRAHPGDGRLDIVDANPSLGDRLRMRRRLHAGTHVPHPEISVQRLAASQLELARPASVYLDAVKIGSARNISFKLEPDAAVVWISEV